MLKILVVILFLFSCSSSPEVKPSIDRFPEFTPIKDDSFAAKFTPKVFKSNQFGNPFAIFYRASKDKEGKIFITYHFVWEGERNDSSGFGPFMSRNIYTGGLSLQKTMFGKGDIELVSLVIEKEKIISIEYETAENYDPSKFGVKHKKVKLDTVPKEFYFEVISWNHLFELREKSDGKEFVILTPSYFTETLWQEYRMTKEKTGFFSRNRAHKEYELEYID
jgi:hypothetical protein